MPHILLCPIYYCVSHILESLASSAGKSSAPSAITTGNPTVRQKNHQRRRQENEATAKSVPLGLDAIGEPTPISALAFELNEPFVDLLYSQKLKVGAALYGIAKYDLIRPPYDLRSDGQRCAT